MNVAWDKSFETTICTIRHHTWCSLFVCSISWTSCEHIMNARFGREGMRKYALLVLEVGDSEVEVGGCHNCGPISAIAPGWGISHPQPENHQLPTPERCFFIILCSFGYQLSSLFHSGFQFLVKTCIIFMKSITHLSPINLLMLCNNLPPSC